MFAEALRLLTAVCGIDGEGKLLSTSKGRAVAAFSKAHLHQKVQAQDVVFKWFEQEALLNLFSGTQLRTCYDCAPKRHRSQFLCLLNRALLVEATRCNGCVRGEWQSVMQNYPELALWRNLRECIQRRVWE